MKNKDVELIVLHVEIQGKGGGNLAVRMYHYKCLIFAHYMKEPVALAIITAKRPPNEPNVIRLSVFCIFFMKHIPGK